MTNVAAPPAARSGAAMAALVGGATAMGLSPVFVRLADVGPFASAFWRVALALPALYVWMRVAERGAVASRGFGRATWLAGCAFTGDLLFWHASILRTHIANATFFATTAPIWVVAFGWLLFGQRAGRSVLAGLALCLTGGAALLGQTLRVAPQNALGDVFGVATGVFFGLYFLAVEAARRRVSAARGTFEASLVTAVLLLAVAAATEPTLWPRSWRGVAALVAMAWISHAGGQGLLSVALGRLPATFSSLVIFLEAIAAAGFAYAFLGEPLTAVQAAGGLLIMAGIYIARPRAD